MGYRHIELEQDGQIAFLWLDRPEKRNALSEDMWADIPEAMATLDADESVRVVVLAGRGTAFSVGIDLDMLATLAPHGESAAVSNQETYQTILRLQKTASCFARSPKPVIAAVHGYCLGAGLDLIASCDVRLAAADATFSIRETRMGLVADIGSLQRLPAIVGSGALALMAYTGDDFDAKWALHQGLVSEVYPDEDRLFEAVHGLAGRIAANSPLATSGIKEVLAKAEAQTVEQSLDYVALWNSSFLLSNDLAEAMAAFREKRDPDFTGT